VETKEMAFFSNLLKEEISSHKLTLFSDRHKIDHSAQSMNSDSNSQNFLKDANTNLNLYHHTNFENGGFALLKAKNWQYLMQKPYCMIGRSVNPKELPSKTRKYKWHVDVDLVTNGNVSRQHAVILYNFEQENYEIKCLSKKNPVKVGDFFFFFKDKPCPLTSKTMITIGNESFVFYLPNSPAEKPQSPIKEEKDGREDKEDKEDKDEKDEDDEKEDKDENEDKDKDRMKIEDNNIITSETPKSEVREIQDIPETHNSNHKE